MPDERISPQQKDLVAARANYCCEYCLSQVAYCPDPFSVDHIVPRAASGANDADNLAFACLGCNNRKFTSTTALDLVTGAVVSLYHPRQHIWREHFLWDDDFLRLIGLTPIGRATIDRLELNRIGVLNLRAALTAIGKHPPNFTT
jgi:hypothetical protein